MENINNNTKTKLEEQLLHLQIKHFDKTNKVILSYIGAFSTIITIIVSLTVTYFNYTNKKKEIALKEMEVQLQKEKIKQSEIETQVKLINFALENYDAFFEDLEKTKKVAGILLAAYPNKQTNKFFNEILKIIPEKNKEEIKKLQKSINSERSVKFFIKLLKGDSTVSIVGREVCIKGVCEKTNNLGMAELTLDTSSIKLNPEIVVNVDDKQYNYTLTNEYINLFIRK